MSPSSITKLSEVPAGFHIISHKPGFHLVRPNQDVVWSKDNQFFNDVMYRCQMQGNGFATKIVSCGLRKAFHIGEREDLIETPPILNDSWYIFRDDGDNFILNFYGAELKVRPLGHFNFPLVKELEILELVKQLPKTFLDACEVLQQSSWVFQIRGDVLYLLTIISHKDCFLHDPSTVDKTANFYNLSRPKRVAMSQSGTKKTDLLKVTHQVSYKYLLFKDSFVLECNDPIAAQIAITVSNGEDFEELYNILIDLWITYDFQNIDELYDLARKFISEGKLVGLVSTITGVNYFFESLKGAITNRLFKLNNISEKQSFIAKLIKQFQPLGWSVLNKTEFSTKKMLKFYQSVPFLLHSQVDSEIKGDIVYHG